MVYDSLCQFISKNIGTEYGEREQERHIPRPFFYPESIIFIQKKAENAGEKIIQGG